MVTAYSGRLPAEEIVRLNDPATGLNGVLVIHSTNLGAGFGGCRLMPHIPFDRAAADALRLAEAMSYSMALSGLPFGGAQSVLIEPTTPYDRAALFRSFAEAVNGLKGRYIASPDVGVTAKDLSAPANRTRATATMPSLIASGLFQALRAAASFALESDLRGLRVAVLGAGPVGAQICDLLKKAGAELLIADHDPSRAAKVAALYNGRAISMAEGVSANADILVPWTHFAGQDGSYFQGQNVAMVKARLVCGTASDPLETPRIAELLMDRGITYVPDYLANSGGAIAEAGTHLGESEASVRHRVSLIGPRLSYILNEARQRQLPPISVANQMAELSMALPERRAA